MIQLWIELTFITLFVIMIFVGSISVPVFVLTSRGRWLWAGIYTLVTFGWTWTLHHFVGGGTDVAPSMLTSAELWWNQYWWAVSLVFYVGIGAVLGMVLRRQWSATRLFLLPVVVGGGVILIAVAVLMVIGPQHLGQTAGTFVVAEMDQMVQQSLAMAKDVPQEQLAMIKTLGMQMSALSLQLLPATIWLLGLTATALTLLLGKRLVPRQMWMKYQGGVTRWKAPSACVWLVIILGALYFANTYGFKMQQILPVVYNGLLAVAGLFLLQGAMITTYYIRRQREGFLRWMWYGVMVLFIQTAVIMMILLGIFDYWVDFRRIEQKIVL